MNAIILIILILFNTLSFAQNSFDAGNKIDLNVSTTVVTQSASFLYKYSVESLATSEQDVWMFWIVTSDSNRTFLAGNIPGWDTPIVHVEDGLEFIQWAGPKELGIKPGEQTDLFSFQSVMTPGFCTFYAEGYHPAPSFEPGMAPDSIPGYEDLTPYGPGIVGKTVGPVLPPAPFVTVDFVDTLASYKHQAFALGWINNQGIVNSLDAKLDNAKKHLEKGKITPAINVLQAFINEVEAQNGKKLTSEAYALLKFNAEFLIDQLSQP